MHGNVKALHHEIEDLGKKRIDYEYDLISGNVKSVAYQPGELDEFYHRYEYDADNRLTHVYTSADGILWEKDARYFYYLHGPLARVELGNDKVQGLDYYYTLQGWIKGVNQPGEDSWEFEMGYDGRPSSTNINQWIGRDEFSYALGYHDEDYSPIGGQNVDLGFASASKTWENTDFQLHVKAKDGHYGLFNGNIVWMITDLKRLNDGGFQGLQAMTYQYDQLHRITGAKSYDSFNDPTWGTDWFANSKYDSDYSYDGNGNLQSLSRSGVTNQGNLESMDILDYEYQIGVPGLPDLPNRLLYVTDDPQLASYFEDDFDGHAASDNYAYDRIGNLIRDKSEHIQEIKWNVYGKVDAVIRTPMIPDGYEHIYYKYDAAGNRLEKALESGNRTHYVRDASGNIMAVYVYDDKSEKIYQKEVPLYGSSRLGQRKFFDRIVSEEEPEIPDPKRVRGEKVYELSNHLGNVLVTISDQKLGEDGPDQDAFADFYLTNTLSATDYYPFGQAMPQRTQSASAYRYGFNGKEYDKGWTANVIPVLDYGFRIYNPALGRFLSVDPLFKTYPFYTPYQFAGNTPIRAIDLDGLEILIPPILSSSPVLAGSSSTAIATAASGEGIAAAASLQAASSSAASGSTPTTILFDPGMSVNRPGSIPGEKAPDKTYYEPYNNDYEPKFEIPEVPRDNLNPTNINPQPIISSGEQLDLFPKSELEAQREERNDKKFWVTYTREKVNPNGSVTRYSGRASGYYKGAAPTRLEALQAIKARYSSESKDHRAGEGYGLAKLDEYSTNEAAIRGREQQLIDRHGGARKDGGNSGNKNRAVDRDHPLRTLFHNESNREFGNIAPIDPIYKKPEQ